MPAVPKLPYCFTLPEKIDGSHHWFVENARVTGVVVRIRQETKELN